MKILNNEETELLKYLASLEATMINKSFKKSNEFGLVMLSNALTSFKDNYLNELYGNIVPSMNSEHRVFIVELLKLVEDEYKDEVLSELLIPKIKDIGDIELLNILENMKRD